MGRTPTVLATCLLGIVTAARAPALLHASVVSTPDSSAAAIESVAVQVSAPVPWAPSHRALERLRVRVGRGAIHIHVGRDVYVIRHPRIDSSGVSFEAPDQDGKLRRLFGGEKVEPPVLVSPLAWERVARIEVHRTALLRGLIAGSVLPLVVVGAMEMMGAIYIEDGDLGVALASLGGPLAGGVLGLTYGHWVVIWNHPR
jgi:hypothetical protein